MSTLSHAASSAEKRTNARYWIVVMLFIVTSFNYGDRATLSIAGSEMAKDIGLDPVGIQELRALVRSFPEHGITVVLSSHILNEVEHMADLVGIIVEGRLAYEAPLGEGVDLERLFMDVCLGKAVA